MQVAIGKLAWTNWPLFTENQKASNLHAYKHEHQISHDYPSHACMRIPSGTRRRGM